jgi:hypothetical protein
MEYILSPNALNMLVYNDDSENKADTRCWRHY